MLEKKYNIRVYGILLNKNNEVLVSDEHELGIDMTKFPGGGLEIGEGLLDGLKREWMEELNAEIKITNHFYTTDFFITSAFHKEQQLISVYYLIELVDEISFRISTKAFDFEKGKESAQSLRWLSIKEMSENDFTFPIDKKVAMLIKNELIS